MRSPRVSDTNPAEVLILGAGVLGAAIAAEFLLDGPWPVSVLIRPAPGRSTAQRLEELKTFLRDSGIPAEAIARLRGVAGDAAEAGWGLAPNDHDALRRGVTHVVHAAGPVRVNLTPAEARRDLVDATRGVLEFSRNAPRVQKLEYISSWGIAGNWKGRLPEGPLRAARCFHTAYEAAKAEAEDLVWAASTSLPVTVHRPTFVVGDSRTGRVRRFQVFYELMDLLGGRSTRGWIPRFPPLPLDAVPADFVARVVATSARQPDWAGRALNLSSRVGGAWTAAQYAERLPLLFAEAGEAVPPPHRIPWSVFRRAVPWMARWGPLRSRPLLRALRDFLSDMDSSAAAGFGVETAQTSAALSSAGIALPAVEEWIRPVLRRYAATRVGEGPR